MAHTLPSPVAEEAASLVHALKRVGYRVTGSLYSPESFGNWYIECDGPNGKLRVVKDRGYFSVEGERTVLEPAGLWLLASQSFAECTSRVSAGLASISGVQQKSRGAIRSDG
jgi:hypothetical protein